MANASSIISDSKINADRICDKFGEYKSKVVNITPYDTRKEIGISQQLTVQKILVAVDNMSESDFNKIVIILASYLDENDKARIHFFTREADYNLPKNILKDVRKVLSDNGYDPSLALDETDSNVSENSVDDMEDDVPVKFFVEQCVDELSASKCIREQRLIVNLSDDSNLYLQISGVSFGIPQVVRKESQYVRNNLNGKVVTDFNKLSGVLDFYLSGLKNWNEAMINAYDIGENYTTRRLVDKWKEVVESIG